ncbi:MAG TPA: hypothetical protein VFE42_08605 [Chloroflexota bacterium]|nr:hypothetical protein [Chloroflexota bacterium]
MLKDALTEKGGDETDGAAAMTWQGAPDGLLPPGTDGDVSVNAESRSYWDGGELVSILSVHTTVCPLIRAELRGDSCVRVLAYYHTDTRLGLSAYEAVLRDEAEVQERLGLRGFLRHTLDLDDVQSHLRDPWMRELYLHEIIRRLYHPISSCCLEPSAEFSVARII